MTNFSELEVADQFLDHPSEASFSELFRVFSPKLVAFFRKGGHEAAIAEDLAQEVMLKVYQKAWQIRDRRLFQAWLFQIARHAVCRHLRKLTREVPTVNLASVDGRFAAPTHRRAGSPALEFWEWMSLLEPREQDLMRLRFVEEWEYHEIASAQSIPIGTVQWRVFNSKKKLAAHFESAAGSHAQGRQRTENRRRQFIQTGGSAQPLETSATNAASGDPREPSVCQVQR